MATRAEAAIKEAYDLRKRTRERIEKLEKAVEDLGEKPIKDKAEIVDTAMKYAGTAVIGGAEPRLC
jgi:septation ring formation regulator EzrA